MSRDPIKIKLKKELKSLFESMDFINRKFLYKKNIDKTTLKIYFNIYQQLGMAWEFLGLQCRHWDGYKKVKGKERTCKICGQVKREIASPLTSSMSMARNDTERQISLHLRPGFKCKLNEANYET